ncbi:carbohydrate ABC transporter substrate-binding protein, partial [Candidatus Sumerlaeota bacterium]|nr:carbohydrate ABC transporter substrate-binding protein [Candidatus Sumerlaeota bacterium]
MLSDRDRKLLVICISLLIFVSCKTGEKRLASTQQTDPRWSDPLEYGRSLNPGRKHLIQILPGLYRPGSQPMGIGPRLKEFRLVADEYERLHPDVYIEFLTSADVAGGSEGEWIRTRLLGGVAPEIVEINTEAVWQDIEDKKGWWIPLDPYLNKPNPYVAGNKRWIDLFANQSLTQAKRAPDGKLYCITLDIVETGIFYNKDILEKVGVTLPRDWQEFLAMQEKLKQAGYI